MSRKPEIEVRIPLLTTGKRELDEVCASNCTVHLEKMSDQAFSLMVYTKHETSHFWIFTKNGKAHIDAREDWREVNDKSAKERTA